jgi:glycosyltransferase involved in cell wall biosynthesis
MTTAPMVSIVRVGASPTSRWNDVARARLAKHTRAAHEIVDCEIDTTFGAAVNRGAARARGEYLVVIRADTLVGPDWLEPLLSICSRWNAVVTPCVKSLDGAVLEAGYMTRRNGDLVAYGRGSTAPDLSWSFVREVSSPSPACFAVPRRAFLSAGGFDKAVAGSPLLETADLTFTLRARGLRTLFQPESTVQIEASSDDPESLPLSRAFRRRWNDALAGMPSIALGGSSRALIEMRDAHASHRLLVIDDRVPHVDRGGGDPRMHLILMELAANWPSLRVTLFALMPDNGAQYARALQQAGIEVVYGANLDEWLASRRCCFDTVMISRPRPVLESVRTTQPQAMLIYDMEAVHFRRYQRMLPIAPLDDVAGLKKSMHDSLQCEASLMAASDVVLCVSDEDRTVAHAIAPATPSFIVSHASAAPEVSPSFEERQDMVFFGAFWNPGSPNEDAVLHLAHRIMPLVWAGDPSIRLVIAGADPTPAVRRLHGDRIIVRGYVRDPNDVLTRARVHVVPMRVGAGIKLRLIDSMAAGLPFVTTTIGAEGLPLATLADTVVADAPDDIARLALLLYRDRDLWTNVQRTIRDIASSHYSTTTLQQQIASAMAAVGIMECRGSRALGHYPMHSARA